MGTPFISAQSLGTLRNNFSGNVGFQFNPSSNVTVDAIGRWVVAGNSQTHQLEIWNITDNVQVATVTVNTSGATSGQYLYGSITPVTLLSTKHYSIQSLESSGGDQFYDSDTTVTPDAGLGSVPNAIFNHTSTNSTTNHSYGPVNFTTTGSSTPVNETLGDSLSLTDSATVTLVGVNEETLSDSLTLTDSIAYDLWGVNEVVVSDSLILDDSIGSRLDYIFADSLSLSDSFVKLVTGGLSFSDTLSLSDSIRIQSIIDKLFFDRLILSDLIKIDAPATSTTGDTLALTDSTRVVLELNLVVSDTLILSDNITKQLIVVLSIVVNDTMTMLDSIAILTSTSDTNYLRDYLNDVQGIRIPETITPDAPEAPDVLNSYLRRYLNDVS